VIRIVKFTSIIRAVVALSLIGGASQAADYAVRDFQGKAHLYRFGTDVVPAMKNGASFFMGVHVRQTLRGSIEPHVLLSLASSAVGNNRYLRLQTKKPTGELEVQAYSRGSGGTDLRLSLGDPLQLGAWYAVGVWVEPSANGWSFTVFQQKHGNSELESTTDTTPSLPYPRLDIYAVARIAYVKATGGPVYSAHNLTGETVTPVFVRNPTQSEIEAFMARADPEAIWDGSRLLASPNLETNRDKADGVAWKVGGSSSDTSLVGTMELGDPGTGGDEPVVEPPVAPILLP
jgi:hypothetical protein